MKICAVICEYNPFHNGHLYHLQEAKKLSGADAILCLMSGNFVQRGEAALLNKFVRAKHAVLGGADAVIELPTIFATSNAELFAKGAVSILSSIPAVSTLCFGAETADKNQFLSAARLLNNEPKKIGAKIKANMAKGMSYAKARANAWGGLLPNDLLSSPNNILGLEYTRAILQQSANINILPIARIGNGYHDTDIHSTFSSASAIRKAIEENKAYTNALPRYVEEELPARLEEKLDALEKYALLTRTPEEIARICDCTEGLEYALQKAALQNASLSESLTSPRYTSSRIRRIALQNLLHVEENTVRACLTSPLYLRVLSIKKERNDILTAFSKSAAITIARAHDENALTGNALSAFNIDLFAEKVYSLLYPATKNSSIFI